MATFKQVLTGTGKTDQFGFRGTDLGFTAQTNQGFCVSIFGDAFDTPGPSDQGWRAPVGLRQSNTDIGNGLVWDSCIGGTRAKEMIPYIHYDAATARSVPGHTFTEIPNDLIQLPDDRYLMTTFGVRDWGDPPHGIKSAGGSWRTWYSRLWQSTDLLAENWERTRNLDTDTENMDYWNHGPWAHFQNNTMIMWPGESYVYVYGTNEGRWIGGGIHLMRVPWDKVCNPSEYRFWGVVDNRWDWRPTGPTTPILLPTNADDPIGEISARVIEDTMVLSYVDGELGAITRTAPYPTGLWTIPKIQVTRKAAPNLYAPAVHPYSTLDDAQILLSQWTRNSDDETTFYGVGQWSGSIAGCYAPSGSAADLLVVTSNTPARVGHRGPLSPQLHRLPAADRIAILDENSDNDVSRRDIAAAVRKRRQA